MAECPQWKLRIPHYLNVPGTTWEQTEISRDTGRQARHTYTIPRLLSPEDPNDCDRNGECIVYHAVEGARGPKLGHEFSGDPTPEMEPVNDEAAAISAKLEKKWETPFTDFKTHGDGEFSDRLLDGITRAFEKVVANNGLPQAPAQQNTGVSLEEFNALKEQLATLQAALTSKQPERRL